MMTDPGREVTLNSGSETYTLYGGNRALRMIERETGKPIAMLAQSFDQVEISLVTTILWALLTRHHPDLTVDDCDDIIDAAGYDSVMEAVGMSLERAFPTPQAAANGAGSGKARRGTGMRS